MMIPKSTMDGVIGDAEARLAAVIAERDRLRGWLELIATGCDYPHAKARHALLPSRPSAEPKP